MPPKKELLSAEKEVRVSIDRAIIGRVQRGVTFEVQYINDGTEKLGALSVSQGGLYWRKGRNAKPHFVDWEGFAVLMSDKEQVFPPRRNTKKPK
jgi:hypothetical protein